MSAHVFWLGGNPTAERRGPGIQQLTEKEVYSSLIDSPEVRGLVWSGGQLHALN